MNLPNTTFGHAGLSAFLRGRRSPDCKIAADWIDENHSHPAVLAALRELYDRLERLGNSDEIRHVALYLAPAVVSERQPYDKGVRCSVCLSLVDPTYADGLDHYHWWPLLRHAAAARFVRLSPSWAAHLMRGLNAARNPTPAPDDLWTVEFLVVHRVQVRADNDIRAEILAARSLPPSVQDAVHKVRVFYPEGGRVSDESTSPDGGFWTPDKEVWQDGD